MKLYEYIGHPEKLNRDSLYELRSLLARYPYYQSARLLFLQNLYLLHDPSFGNELRKAAIYVADCKSLFDLVEGKNYIIEPHERTLSEEAALNNSDHTLALIDQFLQTLPEEKEKESRRNVPVNPAVDYVAYLMQLEDIKPENQVKPEATRTDTLIDEFISTHSPAGRVELPANPVGVAEEKSYQKDPVGNLTEDGPASPPEDENPAEGGCLTETLAKIYIKQRRYSKALEIIRRLNLKNPKKSAYFADQMRFLEKLIINNKNNIE